MSAARKPLTEEQIQVRRTRAEQLIDSTFELLERQLADTIERYGPFHPGSRLCSSRVTLEDIKLSVTVRHVDGDWSAPERRIEDFDWPVPAKAAS